MPVLIVGSVAIDTIKTPTAEHVDLLGGSASFASLSASYFAPVNLVGIVGTDFPQSHLDLFRSRQIDLAGLEIVDGKTFRWSGEYEADMNRRQTLHVELNVFETFRPQLPAAYRDTPIVLLGNISPELQLHVLKQVHRPQFVVADTMDLWITTARSELLNLLPHVDLLVLNDSEARQFTEHENLIRAGRAILELGPKYVAIKKGEHGCVLFAKDQSFHCGAYPLEDVVDPTGAGDTFAGGLVGYLCGQNRPQVTFDDLKRAVVHGSLMASFCVESFSVDRVAGLSKKDIRQRYESFVAMSHFE
ncbi:MAG: bifunctional hydroxymethylpyrimidine kinase/phosphomethylpyrimidine kinase [Verrucomicrobia bacterium]|nr:bifunctional hydroxymethylpyrimidine kinase/phosphomethylpyrimidine kinase [Verrucomicrobiota bacterium]